MNLFNRTILSLNIVVSLAFYAIPFSMSSAVAEEPGDQVIGAKKWAANCSRCHNMRDPSEFSDAYWDTIVKHMRVRAGFTGQDTRDMLAFLQSANNQSQNVTSQPVSLASKPVKLDSPKKTGGEIYAGTCIACHGADGKGTLPGAPDFTDKSGPFNKPDSQLMASMINGYQSANSPMAMPARGGNQSLTDEDLAAALAYMRENFTGN